MSKIAAAQLNMLEPEHSGPDALRQQVVERLAAHRSRRSRTTSDAHRDPHPPAPEPSRSNLFAATVAATVADRYAHSQSYRAFLAAEAENALRRTAEAENALRRTAEAENALRLAAQTAFAAKAPAPTPTRPQAPQQTPSPIPDPPLTEISAAGFTVRLYENVGPTPAILAPSRHPAVPGDPEEARALDEEIAYRQSPTFDLDRPAVPIPGNLLEFPRLLVAARKARPRYAEGPLREDAPHDSAQLRIFEVEPNQLAPTLAADSSAPEWSSIWLDALAKEHPPETVEEAAFARAARPQTASVPRRALAAAIDAAVIAAAFAASAALFRFLVPGQTPPIPLAALASAVTLFLFFLAYQALFFTLADATPGMRAARIGLCTFPGGQPSRAAMRRRIPALLLAACPLGIGILWACLDDDRLGWHDRISRMYPRSY